MVGIAAGLLTLVALTFYQAPALLGRIRTFIANVRLSVSRATVLADEARPGSLDIMDKLERLLALREIDDLIGRYCILFDDQRWDDFGELWTEDAAFVVDGVALKDEMSCSSSSERRLPNGYQTKHIDLTTGRGARRGRNTGDRQDFTSSGSPRTSRTRSLRATTTKVPGTDGWRIRRRSETPLRHQPGPPPMSDDALRVPAAPPCDPRPADQEHRGRPMTVIAFPGPAGRCWPLRGWRLVARIGEMVDQ